MILNCFSEILVADKKPKIEKYYILNDNAHDGITVYTQMNSAKSGGLLEVRFYMSDFLYQADYYGNLLPTKKVKVGSVDRVFVKLPYIEDNITMPINIVKKIWNNVVFLDDEIFKYDIDMFSPTNLITRSGSVFNINQNGFLLEEGKIAVDWTENNNFRYKIFINNPDDMDCKFHLYNNGTKKYIIELRQTELKINNMVLDDFVLAGNFEIDFGIVENVCYVSIYYLDQVYKYSYDNSLEEATEITDTNLEIESYVQLERILAYRGGAYPNEVAGVVPYIDFLDLATTGGTLMTMVQNFGIKNILKKATEESIATLNIIAEEKNPFEFGMINKLTLRHFINHTAEILLKSNKQENLLSYIKVISYVTENFLSKISVSLIDYAIKEFGIKNINAESAFEIALGIKNLVKKSIVENYSLVQIVAEYKEWEAGIKNTHGSIYTTKVTEVGTANAVEKEQEIFDVIIKSITKLQADIQVMLEAEPVAYSNLLEDTLEVEIK